MPPRLSPTSDAIRHVLSKTDKTSKLAVQYINAEKGNFIFSILISYVDALSYTIEHILLFLLFFSLKGRGVFATSKFLSGEFVVEYRGDMIDDVEAQRRRKVFHPSCTAFFFAFKWRGKFWW